MSTEGSGSIWFCLLTVVTYWMAAKARVGIVRLALLHGAAWLTTIVSDFGTAISVSEGVGLHWDKHESVPWWMVDCFNVTR